MEMGLSLRQRHKNVNKRIDIPFRKCKYDDFIKRKLSEDD